MDLALNKSLKIGSIAYLDNPQKSYHGEAIEIVGRSGEYDYIIHRRNGKQETWNHAYLVRNCPIMLGDEVSVMRSHHTGRANRGSKVKVVGIEWDEHASSRAWAACWSYQVVTKDGEELLFDDLSVRK